MKRIAEYRKLLEAPATATLKELNTLYKSWMKKHHPDRFLDEAEKKQAEETSQKVIEAYKFLESIHPETHEKNGEDFAKTTATMITNWQFKAQVLSLIHISCEQRRKYPEALNERGFPSGDEKPLARSVRFSPSRSARRLVHRR